MDNISTAPNALQYLREGLCKKFRALQWNKPDILKPKSRAEIIGKVIEDLTMEITGRDFSNREVAFIIKGITEKGKSTLASRAEYLERELKNTNIAINELNK